MKKTKNLIVKMFENDKELNLVQIRKEFKKLTK